MAPRKRVGRLKDPAKPQISLSTEAVNICGFPALPDEIYLEIVAHIPSVPIPTPISLPSYPEIRHSRHETLLSLSKTCRSLRRVFLRYLWQRIEIREGMKVREKNDILTQPWSFNAGQTSHQNHAVELVRQLEIVTVRNPQLAKHVNYLDVLIGGHAFDSVLAELARCLSLFSNLHTIQIDVMLASGQSGHRSLEKFNQTFKKYSYPQIRNVFVMSLSESLLASCPEARRVGFMESWSSSSLQTVIDNCPRLEALEDYYDWIGSDHVTSKFIVDNFPNLRHITIFPYSSPLGPIDLFTKLDRLQSITLLLGSANLTQRNVFLETEMKKNWLEKAKQILIAVQLRDNLEKFLTIVDWEDDSNVTQTTTLRPF